MQEFPNKNALKTAVAFATHCGIVDRLISNTPSTHEAKVINVCFIMIALSKSTRLLEIIQIVVLE